MTTAPKGAVVMNQTIQVFNDIVAKVTFFFKQLNLKLTKSTGRTLALSPIEIISLGLFKQANGIKTKQSVFNIMKPKCSYKTFVVNVNRFTLAATLILRAILKWNQSRAHLVKHTDSTDVPVCLTKNGKRHKTMRGLAEWGYSAKGWFYGLKMTITTDLRRNLLAVKFGSGNANEREVFKKLNEDLFGIFIADAGFISKDLEREFYIEHKRVLFAKPRANMKRLATDWQNALYDTRMVIELNFRNLKQFYNLETSLPRSIDGYLGNYVYSLLAYVLR